MLSLFAGYFIYGLGLALETILTIYMFIMAARAIISWFSPDPYNPIVSFLIQTTEPLLRRFRRFIPPIGAIDITPIVVFLLIIFLQQFPVKPLERLGQDMISDYHRSSSIERMFR
ncbi:MAG TPA: YggT family protein [Geobacterales bacterium]|nr:YggT family protein [Geobacterales bacterium]